MSKNSLPPAFAFRLWEIETTEQWRPVGGGFPRPPRGYHKKLNGYEMPWHYWTASNNNGQRLQPLTGSCVLRPREATSILWCPESQAFWIAPGNFELVAFRENEDNYHDWTHIEFDKMSPSETPDHQSVYQITTWGKLRQLNYPCPHGFDEYLHNLKFRGIAIDEPVRCHLVGKLSLILALHAMCPDKLDNIPAQIARCFWPGNPIYVPATFDQRWGIRDKHVNPGRALLLETGVALHADANQSDIDRHIKLLEDWEKGIEPMISSW